MPTLLSMAVWVAWRGGVVTHCPAGRDRGRLILHRLHGRGSSWQFLSSLGPSLPRSGEVIGCEAVLDLSQGVRVPCLVTAAGVGATGKAVAEVLVCCGLGGHDSSSLVSCGELSLGDDYSRGSLKVLDGPTVLWSERGTVFLAWRVSGSTGGAMAQHSVDVGAIAGGRGDENYIINHFWCFADPGGGFVLFVRLQLAGPRAGSGGAKPHSLAGDSQWLCLFLSQKGEDELVMKGLPPQHYIPSDYGNIAVCIALHHCPSVDRNGSTALSTEALVGTRYQQVVVLRDGCPVHCIAMETIPTELAVLEISGASFGVAVQTERKEVVAYRVSTTDGPQEVCTWCGVECVLVGDFAHLPRDQLLVVFSDSPEEISDFQITDLAQLHISSEQQAEQAPPQPCADSVASAVRALQVRERVGEAHLLDRQRELQQKTHLLHDSLSLLEPMARRNMDYGHLPGQDQSLLCVLPGRVEGRESHGSMSGPSPSQPVITGSWQRLLEGRWVVGVVLKNTSKCYLQESSLALVTEGQGTPEGGESKAVWSGPSREEGSGSQPAAKRARLEGMPPPSGRVHRVSVCPGGELCLVAWVPLPDVTAYDWIWGSLVCGWRWRGEGCGGGEVQVAEVGCVGLPVRHMMDGSLRCGSCCLQQWEGSPILPTDRANFTLRDHQDMACYLATHQFIRLRATATHTDLHSLPEMLRARLPLAAEHILSTSTASEGGGGGEAPQTAPCKDLEGVYCHVSSSTHTATISVLYRAAATLYLLLAALQSCLPDDVTLSWSSGEGVRELHSCISSLRQEVDRRVEEVTIKMKEERGVANSSGMDCSHGWALGEASYSHSLYHLMQTAEQ